MFLVRYNKDSTKLTHISDIVKDLILVDFGVVNQRFDLPKFLIHRLIVNKYILPKFIIKSIYRVYSDKFEKKTS